MPLLTRRQFLKTTAVVSVATTAGPPPAMAQGTRLHFLQWSHFIPAADVVFEEQAKEFGKQAGVEVAIERINQNDLQARITMDTFGIPGTKVYADKTAAFPETLNNARQVGYAGPSGRAATEALTKFIMVDMYAKAIQGMPPEDAVKWAAAELKKIY